MLDCACLPYRYVVQYHYISSKSKFTSCLDQKQQQQQQQTNKKYNKEINWLWVLYARVIPVFIEYSNTAYSLCWAISYIL